MFQLFAIFKSWILPCIVFLDRVLTTYIPGFHILELGKRNPRLGGKNEVRVSIVVNSWTNAVVSKLPPELILQILQYIPYRTRPSLDMFTDTIVSSTIRFLDVVFISAPLVCSSWHAPGTAALYECITLYTEAQCILLQRTLRENSSLRSLIRFLHLPHSREFPIVTPYSVLQISASLVEIATHIQKLDVPHLARNVPPEHVSITNVHGHDVVG